VHGVDHTRAACAVRLCGEAVAQLLHGHARDAQLVAGRRVRRGLSAAYGMQELVT
jgi:hypothetical protein